MQPSRKIKNQGHYYYPRSQPLIRDKSTPLRKSCDDMIHKELMHFMQTQKNATLYKKNKTLTRNEAKLQELVQAKTEPEFHELLNPRIHTLSKRYSNFVTPSYHQLTVSKPDDEKPGQPRRAVTIKTKRLEKSRMFKSFYPTITPKNLSEDIVSAFSQDYYQYFRNFDKYKDMELLKNSKQNIHSKMIHQQQSLNLLPKKLGVIKDSINLSKPNVNVKGQLTTSGYKMMFSEAIQSHSYKNLHHLNISNNCISETDIQNIVKKLPTKLEDLDLSNNYLNSHCVEFISSFLDRKQSQLRHLNLEKNKLADQGLILLMETLFTNCTLKSLNVSYNLISDKSMQVLGKTLKQNNSLQELYLHYNQITHKGGVLFFKPFLKNTSIKVLDISFNCLGGESDSELADILGNIIAKPHPELVHLDLSYNRLSVSQMVGIQKNLVFNQQLYGMHLEGNSKDYHINSRGFLTHSVAKQIVANNVGTILDLDKVSEEFEKDLIVKQQQIYENDDQLPTEFHRIKGVSLVRRVHDANPKKHDVCWICEGWREVKFVWRPGKSGNFRDDPIFLHLDFEEYQPVIMNQDNTSFYLYRMCPPNATVHYFFSSPLDHVQFYAKDQKTIQSPKHSQLSNIGISLQYADGTVQNSMKLHVVNVLHTYDPKEIFINHFTPNIFSKPREPERIVEITEPTHKRWHLEQSIFRDFISDRIDQCFEFDFEAGKFVKFLPRNEFQEAKQILRDKYEILIAAYKYYASLAQNMDFPRITPSHFAEFIHKTSIMRKKLMKPIDLDISFLSTHALVSSSEYVYVQEKCVVRHQFMEMILRMAKAQYVQTGQASTIGEGVNKMFGLGGELSWIKDEFCANQQWRDERYWNKLMELTIRYKMPLIKYVFEYCLKQKKYVHVGDFIGLFGDADLFEHVTKWELYYIYLQSMMLQENETQKLRHFQMSFIEFVEALARVAERVSPKSLAFKSVSKWEEQPIYQKFESLLCILYMRLPDRSNAKLEKLARKSILHTHQARELGIYESDYEESDDEQGQAFKAEEFLQQTQPRGNLKNIFTIFESTTNAQKNWSKLKIFTKPSPSPASKKLKDTGKSLFQQLVSFEREESPTKSQDNRQKRNSIQGPDSQSVRDSVKLYDSRVRRRDNSFKPMRIE